MQRYALELVSRIGSGLEIVRPGPSLKGGMGHFWEQAYLPIAARKSFGALIILVPSPYPGKW
jgi:hypothetical protein